MLLPPLRERMELLHSLLPQGPDRWESLSKGQVRSSKNMPESSWGMLWVFLWEYFELWGEPHLQSASAFLGRCSARPSITKSVGQPG